MFVRALVVALAAAGCASLLAQPSIAAADAGVTVVIVVPFPPGGGSGAIAEALAAPLGAALAAKVAVDFRPGEDGQAGARSVSAAPPDGRTLLLGSTASLLAPALVGSGRLLDPVAEFEPVTIVGMIPRIIAVHAALPVRTMDDLVRRVRAGGVRCGHSDALAHFAIAEFARLTGTTLDCDDYAGLTPAFREDVTAGRLHLTFESAFLPDVQRGTLRALAVTSNWRLPSLPDVPTASETGVAGLEAVAWLALFAPAGTRAAELSRLREAATAALAAPAVRDVLDQRGFVVRPMTPGQMRAFLQSDAERWRKTQARRAPPRTTGAWPTLARAR